MRRKLVKAFALLLASCVSVPQPKGMLPDPLAGETPGPPLAKSAKKTITAIVALAESWRFSQAEDKLASLPPGHPVRELLLWEVRYMKGEGPLWDYVVALTQKYPRYRAAWELAVLVGEREERWREAAQAAVTLAELVPSGPWAKKSQEFLARHLARGEVEARALLGAGKALEALKLAKALLEDFPQSQAIRELAVRAALAANQVQDAKLLVLPLPEEGSGLELKAQVAAAEEKWALAAALLRRLPDSYPGRCEKLLEAEEKARWQQADPALHQAFTSQRLTRVQLATLLVFYFPQIFEHAQGPSPLYEDVVGLPQQAQVIAVVRAGLLRGDPLTRQFYPRRVVSLSEFQGVLERLALLLNLNKVSFCSEGEKDSCLSLPAKGQFISGRDTVSLFLRIRGRYVC